MTERRPTERTTLLAVLGVTAAALLARLVALGWRVAHQDEGRVADWTLHYMTTGVWEYRPIIHGPFLPHVNGVLFDLLGASDFTMRLAPAVVGGLLPLVAWLLRDRLRDTEVVGVALVLAANPLLLYYSRFMRNDILLAGFATFAFALVVRAIDADRPGYLLAAGLAMGLGTTTKENVLLYPVCWAGALVLVVDARAVLAGADAGATLRRSAARVGAGLRAWWPQVLGGLFVWLATATLFYAPKPELYRALGDPAALVGVVDEATLGSWAEFAGQWADPDARDHSYLEFAVPYWEVMARAALPACLLGALGFLADRYGGAGETPRPVVALAFYWAAFSTLGYPIVMDIVAAWSNVHAVVPLAVPAGVGLALVYRRARAAVGAVGPARAGGTAGALLVLGAGVWLLGGAGLSALLAGEPAAVLGGIAVAVVLGLAAEAGRSGSRLPRVDRQTALGGLSVALLVVAALQTGVVAGEDVYGQPQGPDNVLVQYAQPAGEMQPALAALERAAAREGPGPDVVFYGEVSENADGFEEHHFYTPADYFREGARYGATAPDANEGWPADDTPAPGWFSRLPFPWYTSQFGADVWSTTEAGYFAENSPPVVVAYGAADRETSNSAADIEAEMGGYERYEYQLYQFAEPIVVFVREGV